MCAVPSMAVFCSSLISYFRVMLLKYCLSDLEMVPVAPIITGITFQLLLVSRFIYLFIIIIIIAAAVVVAESEQYEHPVVCMS